MLVVELWTAIFHLCINKDEKTRSCRFAVPLLMIELLIRADCLKHARFPAVTSSFYLIVAKIRRLSESVLGELVCDENS